MERGEPASSECKERIKAKINSLTITVGKSPMYLGEAMRISLARIKQNTDLSTYPKSMIVFGNGNSDYG